MRGSVALAQPSAPFGTQVLPLTRRARRSTDRVRQDGALFTQRMRGRCDLCTEWRACSSIRKVLKIPKIRLPDARRYAHPFHRSISICNSIAARTSMLPVGLRRWTWGRMAADSEWAAANVVKAMPVCIRHDDNAFGGAGVRRRCSTPTSIPLPTMLWPIQRMAAGVRPVELSGTFREPTRAIREGRCQLHSFLQNVRTVFPFHSTRAPRKNA